MKRQLINQFMASDARQVGVGLLASMEELELDHNLHIQQEEAVSLAGNLAVSVKKSFPDNEALQSQVATVLNTMTGGSGVVSCEGLADLLGQVFGNKKPKYKDDDDEYLSYKHNAKLNKFLAEMKKTYLNRSWLAKQTFIEGTVKATDISSHFIIDGKLGDNPLGNIEIARKRIERHAKAWMNVIGPIHDQVQSAHKNVMTIWKRNPDDTDTVLDAVRSAIGVFNAQPDPMPKFPKFEGTSLKNLKLVGSKDGVESLIEPKLVPEDSMPALKIDQVMEAAQIINAIFTEKNWDPSIGYLPWLDFKDGTGFPDWLDETDRSLDNAYWERFYHQREPENWTLAMRDMIETYGLAKALIKWIDRSIK